MPDMCWDYFLDKLKIQRKPLQLSHKNILNQRTTFPSIQNMVSASFLLSLAFGLLPLVKSSEIIPFDYSYPLGAPAGCCNGYYDDPNLDILNNGDMPTWIGITNCIQWDAEENDFKPLLDLGTSFNVEKIEVSYIINVGMGKTDVESISCSASFDEPEVGNTQWDYEATEVATTENLVAGGYIFTLTTNN